MNKFHGYSKSLGFFAFSTFRLLLLTTGVLLPIRGECGEKKPQNFKEVLVYPLLSDGSMMHWLAISPLRFNVSFLGDSMSADVLKQAGVTERTVRPRAGDIVQGQRWHKVHLAPTTCGPTMGSLFQVAGRGFDYAITCCQVYIYSPRNRPNAIFAGSSDDALKVILNGKKIWSNQIQRSPSYDSDQAPAPLKKGWNSLLLVVDQVWGGHLVCARFLDGGEPVKDIEVSLDPPTKNARRYPAAVYNQAAAELMRSADKLRLDGKLPEASAVCGKVLAKYRLSDVAPRAAHTRATILYDVTGGKSLGKPAAAAKALEALLAQYGQDLLAEYALLDLGKIQEQGLKDPARARATYRSFERLYPRSSLAAKALVELARLLAEQRKFEEAILTYRKAIGKYPKSDEVMTATVGIGDTYREAGAGEKALKQYEKADAMARDWHDNKYGVDVGKQAWLRGIIDYLRKRLAALR